MPRAETTKLYRTFVKGLITEAGFLTYPEDASTDELNTVLHKKGNRTRRLGIDYEPESVPTELQGVDETSVVSEHFWKTVANKADIDFLCVQVANILHFYDTSKTPYEKKDFTVNIIDYKSPTATDTQVISNFVAMASGKGYLFVAQEYIDPFLVDYKPETDTIEVVRIVVQIRDFDGIDDGLANDQEPDLLSKEHHYNLRNQGWVAPGTPVVTPAAPDPDVPAGGGNVTPNVEEYTYYDPYTGTTRTYRRDQYQEEF